MKGKNLAYSTLRNALGLSSKSSMKDDESESLAAITHYFHRNKIDRETPLFDRVAEKHLRYLSKLFGTDSPSSTGKQQRIPFTLDILDEFRAVIDVPFPPPSRPRFTFIDLFAGIGGMRLAFQEIGGKCVFSSEIDTFAKCTYEANFGEVPFGDIQSIDEGDIPDHDVLVGGFPCQAFSIAGKRKGFDEARGTLFFEIARILDVKRPRYLLLENVKGLRNHKGGETLRVILKILRDNLGYTVPEPVIVNAKYFGVPQNRERVFIVGFRDEIDAQSFAYPNQSSVTSAISDILEDQVVDAKYYLSQQYLNSIREHRRRHEARGHGFGYEIIPSDGIANAIVVGGMGRERNLVIDHRLLDRTPTTKIGSAINTENIRRMTPREWARLQGFPDEFIIPVSDAQAYKQFGNSVAVPAIRETAKALLKGLAREKKHR